MAISETIGSLRVLIGGDASALDRSLASVEERTDSVGHKMTALKGVLEGVAVAWAVEKVTEFVRETLDVVDAQAKMAARIGASVEAVQTLDRAAALAGISAEGLSKSVGVLNQRLGEAARTGSGPTFDALQRLGLSVQDLLGMDADKRLAAIGDAMESLGYTAAQRADTMRQFGLRSQEMLNIFEGGGDKIREARGEIEKTGQALSDVQADKIELAKEALDRMGMAFQGIATQITLQLAPYIGAVADKISDLSQSGIDFGQIAAEAIHGVLHAFSLLQDEFQRDSVGVKNMIILWEKAVVIANMLTNALGHPFMTDAQQADMVTNIQKLNSEVTKLSDPNNLPSKQVDAFFQGIEDKATEEAQKLADLRKQANLDDVSGGGGGALPDATDAEKKAAVAALKVKLDAQKKAEDLAEQTAKAQADKLAALNVALLSERDAEQNSYAQRMADLKDFYDQHLVTLAEYNDLAQREETDHAAKLKNIDQQTAESAKQAMEQRQQSINNILDDVSGIITGLFGQSKAAAIAQAVISAYEGISRTLGAYPYPINIALAAAHAAVAFAQIAKLRSTTPNSTTATGPSGGGGASSVPALSSGSSAGTPAPAQQTLFVQGINATGLFSGEVVRNIAQKLIDFQKDGGKVVLE